MGFIAKISIISALLFIVGTSSYQFVLAADHTETGIRQIERTVNDTGSGWTGARSLWCAAAGDFTLHSATDANGFVYGHFSTSTNASSLNGDFYFGNSGSCGRHQSGYQVPHPISIWTSDHPVYVYMVLDDSNTTNIDGPVHVVWSDSHGNSSDISAGSPHIDHFTYGGESYALLRINGGFRPVDGEAEGWIENIRWTDTFGGITRRGSNSEGQRVYAVVYTDADLTDFTTST